MVDQFIVPKEPKLGWKMLLPSFRQGEFCQPLHGRPIHYLFWARNAIYHGLSALRISPGENILVPSFHCTSVVAPMLEYGGEVKFYDIGLDLKPDFNDIKRKIDGKTRVILAIHYFGFPQPIRQFRELCRERGLYLIEDCAHVLTGRTEEGAALGNSGDISIFSWRKFLPLYDGGQLVFNNPKIELKREWEKGDFLFSLKVLKNTLEKLVTDSSGRVRRRLNALWRLLSLPIRGWVSRNSGGAGALTINSYDLNFDMASANLRMSNLSKYILANTDIKEVVNRRRGNYKRLCEEICSMNGVAPLYPDLPEDVCPWVFPLLVYEFKDLHLILRARGIPATTWSGVIHASLPLEEFPDARFLYENLVFLPIHQSIEEEDVQKMTRILRDITQTEPRTDAKSFTDRVSLSAVRGR